MPVPRRHAKPAPWRVGAIGPRDWLVLLRVRMSGCLLALLLTCVAGGVAARPAPPLTAPPGLSLEYAVKATYLYKFAPFVNWPADEFSAADTPFRICVVGDDPFGGFLDKAVAGRGFNGHPFEVRHLASLTPDAACQIVYLGGLPPQDMRQALGAVDGKPVLTVTDSRSPSPGGIVHFVIDHGRVGFEIDNDSAERNHLTISSKLLSLAVAVRGGS